MGDRFNQEVRGRRTEGPVDENPIEDILKWFETNPGEPYPDERIRQTAQVEEEKLSKRGFLSEEDSQKRDFFRSIMTGRENAAGFAQRFEPSASPSGIFSDRFGSRQMPPEPAFGAQPVMTQLGVTPESAFAARAGVPTPKTGLQHIFTGLETADIPRQQVKKHILDPVVPDFNVSVPLTPEIAGVPLGPAGTLKKLGVGVPEKLSITDEVVTEIASWIADPLNVLPVVGFGPEILRGLQFARKGGLAASRAFVKGLAKSGDDNALKALKSAVDSAPTEKIPPKLPSEEVVDVGQAGRGTEVAIPPETPRTPPEPVLGGFDDPHVARADPGPPPPREPVTGRAGGKEPPGRKPPTPDDPDFDEILRVRLKGEKPAETLVRRQQGTVNVQTRIAANEARDANQMLVDAGVGRKFRGAVVVSEEGAADELYRLLHNPSKVASGEMVVPDNLRPVYDNLRAQTDFEQAARLDFDPKMATVEDYFYRGWKPPEGMFTGEARGPLGRNPRFKMPRTDASFDEMIEAGFRPLFENPVEQARHSRLMGIKYREQMNLIKAIKAKELAFQVEGPVPKGYRVPEIGPAFEGKPHATADGGVAYTRRWAVEDGLANRLENAYGKLPDMGTGEIFGKTIDFQKAVDAAVFLPKRAKLIGSVFQHVDFMSRSGFGAWTGAIDALRRGHPIESVYHLLKWPQSSLDIMRATFSPNFRARLAKLSVDDTPLLEGRKVSNKMIGEAGLSLRDETILPGLDDVIKEVRAEGKAAKWGKKPFRLLADLEKAWRDGLFEGVYPAAILSDVKNNIAPMMARKFPNATDEQLAGYIAKAANTSYSTIPGSMSVIQNRAARGFLTRFLFSLNENEGLLRAFTGAIRGENASYFRTRLLGTYLGVMTLANTIHFVSTGEPLPFNRYAPISKDNWGPLPLGYNRDFAAPNIPLTGRSGAEITLDLMGQMDTAFRILNPESFLNARTSVPVRAGINQATGEDFFGAPIDTVGPEGIFSRTTQLINDLFAPIGPGQAGLELLRQNIEETEGLIQPSEGRLGAAGLGVQGLGVNLRAETTPQLVDRHRREVMQEMKIEKSYDEVTATDSPLKNEIDAKVEGRIGPELDIRQEMSELRGQTTPESKGFQAIEESRAGQETEQLEDDQKLNSGQWAGDVWREKFSDRQRTGFDNREQIKRDFGIEFADKDAPLGSVNAVIDAYFDVKVDDHALPDGTTDWKAFFGAQEDALSPLSPSDEKRVLGFIHQYDTPTVTQFRGAQEIVDRFYETPKYKGLSLEQGQEVDRILNEDIPRMQLLALRDGGRELERGDLVRAIARDIADREVARFLMRNFARRGKHTLRRARQVPTNPERDAILTENQVLLAQFYPDLLQRQLSREQEAELGAPAFAAVAR